MTASPSRSAALDEGPLEIEQRPVDDGQRTSQPEPEVEGDLVVARSAGVQLAGDRPDARREGRLEVEVDVLQARVPGEAAGGHLLGQALQPRHERGLFDGRQELGPRQAVHVRDRAGQVVERQRAVDLDRAREVGGQGVGLGGETAAPHAHRVADPPWVECRRAVGRLSFAAWPLPRSSCT